MTHAVEISHQAAKSIRRLDAPTQRRVLQRLNELAAGPTDPQHSKPLVGMEGLRSSRVGGWRILFTIADAPSPTVYIVDVRKRGEAYR